jgi:hypothetical protein
MSVFICDYLVARIYVLHVLAGEEATVNDIFVASLNICSSRAVCLSTFVSIRQWYIRGQSTQQRLKHNIT